MDQNERCDCYWWTVYSFHPMAAIWSPTFPNVLKKFFWIAELVDTSDLARIDTSTGLTKLINNLPQHP